MAVVHSSPHVQGAHQDMASSGKRVGPSAYSPYAYAKSEVSDATVRAAAAAGYGFASLHLGAGGPSEVRARATFEGLSLYAATADEPVLGFGVPCPLATTPSHLTLIAEVGAAAVQWLVPGTSQDLNWWCLHVTLPVARITGLPSAEVQALRLNLVPSVFALVNLPEVQGLLRSVADTLLEAGGTLGPDAVALAISQYMSDSRHII